MKSCNALAGNFSKFDAKQQATYEQWASHQGHARGPFAERSERQQFLHLSNAECNARLVFRARDPIRDSRKLLAILRGVLLRPKVEPQFVDLTRELEWTIVAILDHRDTSSRVLTDIEVFVFWELDRG